MALRASRQRLSGRPAIPNFAASRLVVQPHPNATELVESGVDEVCELLECRPRQRKEHAVPVVRKRELSENNQTFRITPNAFGAFPPLGFLGR
jgi:hypothetical protein